MRRSGRRWSRWADGGHGEAFYGAGVASNRAAAQREQGGMSRFAVSGFDHIVLCVRDVPAMRAFYERVLGMESREERPGKWSLHFGHHKISLQDAVASPSIAKDTVPGSGNFCLISTTPVAAWREHLAREGVQVIDSGERAGATGPIDSLYFKDPDGNLVEVSYRL